MYRKMMYLAVVLLITAPVCALETFKVSNYGGAHQIWFEAEDFDERDPANDSSFAVVDEPDAFGQAISSLSGTDGASMIRYTFDISKAGGKGGTWYFWGRVINPSNQSDFMLIEGHPGDPFPIALPVSGLVDAQRAFEGNAGPPWTWFADFTNAAHVKELRDGENNMVFLARQSGALWDVLMWTDDPDYVPTDEDYENAAAPTAGTAAGPSPSSEAIDVAREHRISWTSCMSTVSPNG